jgi:hypothetical protein
MKGDTSTMRSSSVKLSLLLLFVACVALSSPSARAVAVTGQGPTLASIGPLTFGPDGTLFAADNQNAAIFALDLGAQANGGAQGTKALDALDQKLAALVGTAAAEISITDLAVDPRTQNSYISVMRGRGNDAAPALFRVDGAGKIDMLSLSSMKFSKVELPNAPVANTSGRQNPRSNSITDLAFTDGRLWVAGLSNEEFSSKLRAIPYPFNTIDAGTSVEIYHGNHQAVETRSPVFAFVPYMVNGQPNLVAGYLCTPLVKFPISSLKPGEKVRGTTVAELGAGNRPLDMILYKKDGKDFLLMSNSSRGVMKIPAGDIAAAAPITTPVTTPTGGIPYETIASMQGVQQLDLLNAQNSIVITSANGAMNLQVQPLP